jgi:hypothetical protein
MKMIEEGYTAPGFCCKFGFNFKYRCGIHYDCPQTRQVCK